MMEYDLSRLIRRQMKHIDQGLPDYGIQREQQKQRHKAPEAAAHHADAFSLYSLLISSWAF